MVAPALIGAAGSLLGGLFGRNSEKKAIAAQNAYNDPAAVRARFEAAGFNPLLGIQPGVGMQQAVGGTNYIGQAIADSVGALASAWSETAAKKARKQSLERENTTLRRQLEVDTIRPKVSGGYGRPAGQRISISGPASGWVSEYDADFIGKEVQLRPDNAYNVRNRERTAIMTPLGETTPANQSDAEEWEKRYGDPVSWAVGAANLFADGGTSIRAYTDSRGWTDPTKWVGGLLGNPLNHLPDRYQPKAQDKKNKALAEQMRNTKPFVSTAPFTGNHLVPQDWWKQQ